jgi:hypothetical protein
MHTSQVNAKTHKKSPCGQTSDPPEHVTHALRNAADMQHGDMGTRDSHSDHNQSDASACMVALEGTAHCGREELDQNSYGEDGDVEGLSVCLSCLSVYPFFFTKCVHQL